MADLLFDDQDYYIEHGDCIPFMASMPPKSVDMSVYSPPFPSVFSYTSLPEDLGNTEDLAGEVKLHFSYFFRQMIKIMKPGRVMMVHCNQIIRMKRTGGDGVYDFRGLLIRLAERAGFTYKYEWTFRRNPQAQAIRTRSRELQFLGLETDRSQSRGSMPDYLLKFVAPGVNAVPINSKGQVSRNEWIDWAEDSWSGISESDNLNIKEGRSDSDTRHICPMNLCLIERLVRLFSNPNEIVFSPFTGIGSEGFTALKLGRRFVGSEIKDEYHRTAIKNMERALEERKESENTLFDMTPELVEEKIVEDVAEKVEESVPP